MMQLETVERKSGVALWRQIADAIRLEIAGNQIGHSGMMPGEMALAARFGVNRHTVRAAIAALVDEGLLETVQGRGTMIRKTRRYTFPIGRRTRFSDGLADQTDSRAIVMVGSGADIADDAKARMLAIEPGDPLVRIDLVASADGTPLSFSRNWFRADLLAGIIDAFTATGSVTRALASLGVADYLRQSTELTGRLASEDECRRLDLRPGAVALLSRAVNATPDGMAFQMSETVFAADRVTIRIEQERT